MVVECFLWRGGGGWGLSLGRASNVLFRVGAAAVLVCGADPKELLKCWLLQTLDAGVWVTQLGRWGCGAYCMG